MWSVLVVFMGPEYSIDAPGKFFLVAVPTLAGSALRLPYTFAVARFDGRNWTIMSALLLLIPTVLAAIVMQPGTSYSTFIAVAAVGGLGGGNFASSMVNINTFFPEARKGGDAPILLGQIRQNVSQLAKRVASTRHRPIAMAR